MHEEQILDLIQAGLRVLTQMLSFIPIWLLQHLETTKYNDSQSLCTRTGLTTT